MPLNRQQLLNFLILLSASSNNYLPPQPPPHQTQTAWGTEIKDGCKNMAGGQEGT